MVNPWEKDAPPTKVEQELLDRTRRMETRLTRYLLEQGVELGTMERPWWDPDFIGGPSVHIPSINTALADILKTVPSTHKTLVFVVHKNTQLFAIAGQRFAAIQDALQKPPPKVA